MNGHFEKDILIFLVSFDLDLVLVGELEDRLILGIVFVFRLEMGDEMMTDDGDCDCDEGQRPTFWFSLSAMF
jgi:hypothetical protein